LFQVLAALAAGTLAACGENGLVAAPPDAPAITGPTLAPPSSKCILGFDLTMVETNPVRSDGLGTYVNKQQKVVAFTGSGDGFRFDTNGSQQVETAGDPRHVRFDFAGTGAELDASFLSGVDFRFTSGLNLCTQPVGTSASVTVGINFISRQYPGRTGRLQYGGRHPPEGDDCGARGVSPATLTRVATDTWSVASGPSACLYYFAGSPGFDRVVQMPLGFTIRAQGPVL
jgi:hypothetical protein